MATFDAKLFNRIVGQTNMGTAGATLTLAFGLPLSFLALTMAQLELVPTPELSNMLSLAQSSKSRAGGTLKAVYKKIMMDSGVIEYSTDSGKSIIYHKASKNAFWFNDNELIENLDSLVNALDLSVNNSRKLYSNKEENNSTKSTLSNILKEFLVLKSFTSGSSAQVRENFLDADSVGSTQFEGYIGAYYASETTKAASANDFITRVSRVINGIKEVLYKRSRHPELEPNMNADSYYDEVLARSNFNRGDVPEDEALLTAEQLRDPDAPIFDLIYGPPRSNQGQFLLSEDGLYYDSQSGGLDPVFVYLKKKQDKLSLGEKWKFEEDPNLGGRGTAISYAELQSLKSDLFNLEVIDDSDTMQEYYDRDHFLQVLIGHKNKHIYDTSAYLSELIAHEGDDSAMVINLRQSLYSDIARHDHKVNRRKKQVEVAIKAPRTFNAKVKGIQDFSLTEIPINDFSYLKDLNIDIDIDSQKKLVFNQSEVSGVILPLNPKFVIAPSYAQSTFDATDLLVPNIGRGQISYGSSSVSGTDANITSLSDQITTNGLIAIYNFLEPKTEDPKSVDYQVVNCAVDKIHNNAQLVGVSPSSVFVSGLGIPYLKGILETEEMDSNLGLHQASSVGSYVKLNNTEEFRNLGYRKAGFTFESWVHVPNMDNTVTGWHGGDASSITKVLLGCENIGFTTDSNLGSPDNFDKISPDFGDTTVRGLLLGFTRDRRISKEGEPFDNTDSQNKVGDTAFFLAPTQSVNDASSVAFLNNGNYANNSCPSSYNFHKMVVSATTSGSHGKFYQDVSSSFMLVNVAVDPSKDEIRMSLDGEIMATSSLSEVFGTRKYNPINIPSLARSNSFEYNSSSVSGIKKLQEGPKLHKSGTITPIGFTPWVLGGGYTDGMYEYGNFMGRSHAGNSHGGTISGLRGFIGSTKFYNRALNSSEVKKNYASQYGFFKNISI
jgi:hypothetical protein